MKTTTPVAAPVVTALVSKREAAQLLSVSLSSVDKLIETGQLPAYRVLRTVRLRLSDVMNVAVPR